MELQSSALFFTPGHYFFILKVTLTWSNNTVVKCKVAQTRSLSNGKSLNWNCIIVCSLEIVTFLNFFRFYYKDGNIVLSDKPYNSGVISTLTDSSDQSGEAAFDSRVFLDSCEQRWECFVLSKEWIRATTVYFSTDNNSTNLTHSPWPEAKISLVCITQGGNSYLEFLSVDNILMW